MIKTSIFIAICSFVLQTALQHRTNSNTRFMKVWKYVHVAYISGVFYVVMFTFPGLDVMTVLYCVLAWGAITDIRFTVPCICGAVAAAIFQSLFGG